MRHVFFAALFVILGGCATEGVDTAPQRDQCTQIALEMADTVKHLRLVSFEPDPDAIDLLIEQASDYEECIRDSESH